MGWKLYSSRWIRRMEGRLLGVPTELRETQIPEIFIKKHKIGEQLIVDLEKKQTKPADCLI